MLTMRCVQNGYTWSIPFDNGKAHIGRDDIVRGRELMQADAFISRNSAALIQVVDGVMHIGNKGKNSIRLYNYRRERINRICPHETAAFSSHDIVRFCPNDHADGVSYTEFNFYVDTHVYESPFVESLPMSQDEGQSLEMTIM